MPKSSQYWKEYNQKRKSYLTQKKREARKRAKVSTTFPALLSTTNPEIHKVVDRVVDTSRNKIVDILAVVDKEKVVDSRVVDNSILTQLIQEWQTQTNYNCASTCAYSYCNNCWYFQDNQLIDYKEVNYA